MRKNRQIEIKLPIILLIVLLIIGSAKIISLAMEEKQETNYVAETTNIIEQNCTNENIIVAHNNVVTNNIIEEKPTGIIFNKKIQENNSTAYLSIPKITYSSIYIGIFLGTLCILIIFCICLFLF